MFPQKIIYFVIILLMFSCSEDNEIRDPLTSIIWDKNEVLHIPANLGFWSTNGCTSEYVYRFQKNGEYTIANDCNGTIAYAKWAWITIDKEIELSFGGKYPAVPAKRIEIIRISNQELHTIERDLSEPDGTENYWELIYKPK